MTNRRLLVTRSRKGRRFHQPISMLFTESNSMPVSKFFDQWMQYVKDCKDQNQR